MTDPKPHSRTSCNSILDVRADNDLNALTKELKKLRQEVDANQRKDGKMIGKKVIVRASVAGVHAGIVESLDGTSVVLKDAYRLWRFYTRDKTGSISDIAANGLKEGADHQIGAKLSSVYISNPQGLEVAEMTDDAYKSLEKINKA